MIKIKTEPGDDIVGLSAFNEVKNEVDRQENNLQMEIKQEHELIIEPEVSWLPTKLEDEQQEYYTQYQQNDVNEEECYILPSVEPDTEYEEYSIEYVNEEVNDDSNDHRYYENYDNEDEDSEDENDGVDITDYVELIQNSECGEGSKDLDNLETASGGICKDTFLKWLCGDYIQHLCPICDNKFEHYKAWCQHINNQHQDLIDDAKSKYYINDNTRPICKICMKQFNMDFVLLIHSMRHASENSIKMFICSICEFKSTKCMFIQNHIIEQHPETVELFKNLNITTKKNVHECPLCPAKYHNYNHIRYHFMDSHPKEYWEKYRYQCSLCYFSKDKYDNEQAFYKHLIEDHNLSDLKLLSFKKLSENPEQQHFCCTKCFKIFTEMNYTKFLQHYLEHDTTSYWLCKFCSKKTSFRHFSYYYHYHMCPRMLKAYKKRVTIQEENTPSSSCLVSNKEKKDLSDWQEFVEYILHICPFCNKEFDTLQKWQMHLRKLHELDTLKGLDMETLAEDSNKLKCKTCFTLINNSSVQLHAHRFQHLPYKPYKCRHCSEVLNNYKIALAHVLNKCQDSKDQSKIKDFFVVGSSNRVNSIRECFEISCSLCNNQTFPDVQAILRHYNDQHNNFVDYFSQQLDNSMRCNICQQQFAIYDKKLCVSHVIQHLDQKTYKCLICSQSYRTYKVCMHHLQKTHFAKAINPQKIGNNSLTKAQTSTKARMGFCPEKSNILNEFIDFICYACPECNVSLATQQLWHDHIIRKHNFFDLDNLSVEDPLDGSVKCQHCPLKLPTSIIHRKKHKLTHMPHRSFICNLCYHRCTTLGVLYGHLRRLHFIKGSFKCPICPDILTTPYERSEHIKSAHPRSEWPPSLCLVCYKTLSSTHSLNIHMITHNLNRPKYECEYCGAKICELKDFKIHIGRHQKAMEGTTEEEKSNDSNKTQVKDDNTNKNSNTDDAEQKINEIVTPNINNTEAENDNDSTNSKTPTNKNESSKPNINLLEEKVNKRKSNTKQVKTKKKIKTEIKTKRKS